MAEKTLVPEAFGPLQGVKIVSSGTLIAAAVCRRARCRHGRRGDPGRTPRRGRPGMAHGRHPAQDARRQGRDRDQLGTGAAQRFLHLARPHPAARARACSCACSNAPTSGWKARRPGPIRNGASTIAAVWKVNPKLVITHVSSYGQYGHPDYIGRTSYDIVGQAFGGIMYQTGFPDTPPSRAAPWTGDYLTALFTLWSSLAG